MYAHLIAGPDVRDFGAHGVGNAKRLIGKTDCFDFRAAVEQSYGPTNARKAGPTRRIHPEYGLHGRLVRTADPGQWQSYPGALKFEDSRHSDDGYLRRS